jgi:hypothetical protein
VKITTNGVEIKTGSTVKVAEMGSCDSVNVKFDNITVQVMDCIKGENSIQIRLFDGEIIEFLLEIFPEQKSIKTRLLDSSTWKNYVGGPRINMKEGEEYKYCSK